VKRQPQASAPFSSLSPVASVEAGRGLLAVERDDGVRSSSGWFKGSSHWEKAEGGGGLVLSVAERKGKVEREEEE